MKTDWKDYLFTQRKYTMTTNGDGTVTPVDKTEYTQTGNTLGAKELNEMGQEFNALSQEVAETKKSVSDGKALLAAAITLKKVATSATDTFAKMAANIKLIKTGAGSATPGDVLAGKTFSSDAGEELSGTMVDYGGQWLQSAASLDGTNKVLLLAVSGTGRYNSASRLYAAYSTIASLIGLTSAKLWPGASMLGVTSSNSSMGGGTYTPNTAQQTVSCSGKAMTGNIVINPIPSNYYNANNNQTVFNYGSYGIAGSMGAYYADTNNLWHVQSTPRPIAFTSTGGIFQTGTNGNRNIVFRASFPATLKYIRITGAGKSSTNFIQIFVIDPSTYKSVGYREVGCGGDATFVRTADLSAFVSTLPKGYWLGIYTHYSMGDNGIWRIELGTTKYTT